MTEENHGGQEAPQRKSFAQLREQSAGAGHIEDAAPAAPVAATSATPVAPQDGQNQQKTNGLAIVSLVSAFFVSLVAIITGHIALKQIKRSNGAQKGRGLAIAGTVLGYLGLVAGLAAAGIMLAGGLFLAQAGNAGILTPEQQRISEEQTRQSGEAPSAGDEEAESTGDPSTEPTAGVQGHAVSPAFCEKLEGAATIKMGVEGGMTVFTDEAKQAWADVAALESPNQAVYADFAKFVVDQSSVDSSVVVPAWSEAIQEDAAACA